MRVPRGRLLHLRRLRRRRSVPRLLLPVPDGRTHTAHARTAPPRRRRQLVGDARRLRTRSLHRSCTTRSATGSPTCFPFTAPYYSNVELPDPRRRRSRTSRSSTKARLVMPKSILDMSMSLDGYIADPNDYLGGEDGERLHRWASATSEPDGPVAEFESEWNACGAVLAGRRTVELMDHWGGDHAGSPIFVPSHRPPPPAARWGYPLVTYVSDGIESAMNQAKAAAGERDVQVRGGRTQGNAHWRPGCWTKSRSTRSQSCLALVTGCSTRCHRRSTWRSSEVIDTPAATHIRYRVRRSRPQPPLHDG